VKEMLVQLLHQHLGHLYSNPLSHYNMARNEKRKNEQKQGH
jgi:hypothetical protein